MFCDKIDVEELKGYIKKETGLHAYISFEEDAKEKDCIYVNLLNISKNSKCRACFTDFDVIPLENLNNKNLNQLKFIWNKFLVSKFGENYKKAYHAHYFRNVDIDILKKDDTQDK